MTITNIFMISFFSISALLCTSTETPKVVTEEKEKFQHHVFQVGEESREMGVFLPKQYNQEKTLPVVLVLHGGGGNMRSFAKKTKWVKLANDKKIIVVFMQALERCLVKDGKNDLGNYWLTDAKKELLCDQNDTRSDSDYLDVAIAELFENYKIKKDQIYAAGFSNGLGYILQNIITRHPNIFAAVGGSSSLIHEPLEGHGDLPVSIILGNRDDRFTKHSNKPFYKLNAEAILSDKVQGGAIRYLTDYLEVKKKYTIKKGKESIQLDFEPSLNQPNAHFRYQLLKNVGHKFPSGNKKSNYFDAAELLWSFFENHKLKN